MGYQVSPTSTPDVWVREVGFVSTKGSDGPWSLGTRVCINSDLVRLKGRTPKYYYVVVRDYMFLYVHRLVALAFCENPNLSKFRMVDHISGDSLSNASHNLRWLNHQLNCMNQTRTVYHKHTVLAAAEDKPGKLQDNEPEVRTKWAPVVREDIGKLMSSESHLK